MEKVKKSDIIKVIVLAIIIIWIIIFFIDYFRARQSKTPIFCILLFGLLYSLLIILELDNLKHQFSVYLNRQKNMMMVRFILVLVLVIKCISMTVLVLMPVLNLDHSLLKRELNSSFFSLVVL